MLVKVLKGNSNMCFKNQISSANSRAKAKTQSGVIKLAESSQMCEVIPSIAEIQ